MKRILVTGAAGFIGSQLVTRLFKEVNDATIVGLDSVNDYYDVRIKEYRLQQLDKLAIESAVAPSSIKNILYGKSLNPGIVTLKMLCDGFGISIVEFFDTDEFRNLEQEIK